MRKINLILAVIALCGIAVLSCKKDEPAAVKPYLGSWREAHFVSSGCTDAADNEDHVCPEVECEVIAFSETQITITKAGTDPPVVYSYTASGTTLTVNAGTGGTITVTVVVVGTTLTLTLQNTPADGNCTHVTTYNKVG